MQMFDLVSPQIRQSIMAVLAAMGWLSAVALIFVPLERLFAAHPQRILRKGIGTDICYYFLSSLLPALLLSAPLAFIAWMVRCAIPSAIHEFVAEIPFAARVALSAVVCEIGYYWGHRWSHENNFLWKFHAIHHSAEEIDFLVTSRAHPIDFVFTRLCEITPIYVLGLAGPESGASGFQIPVLLGFVGMIWGFFIHSNVRWRFGPLEWVISTPAFHHWHHTRTGPIHSNFSSTFPWIDRIFGTHYLPRHELPMSYGINGQIPDSLLGQLAFPLIPDATPGDGVAEAPPVQPNEFPLT